MKKNTVKIKVIGVGGSGSNAVSRMMKCQIKGVDLIAVNTDVQDLRKNKAHQKVRIGKKLTKGLGAGMNPEIGKKAAEEQKEELKELFKDTDMTFIASGLGGGTGSGATPVIAEISKNQGALTIAVVTKPFSFEGGQRKKIAERGLKNLENKVDTLLVIPNDKLLKDRNYPISQVFWMCDEVLRQAVSGISDLILMPGIINVDFADIRTVMKNSGPALFGIGRAQGEKRAEEAAILAINSPLLDFSISGAKAVLFNVSGGKDMTLSEVNQVAKIINQKLSSKAKVIFGAAQDNKLKKGELKVTVLATGF
ncbi:cell division protein FtsZ [Patescibacteria group bacterium]